MCICQYFELFSCLDHFFEVNDMNQSALFFPVANCADDTFTPGALAGPAFDVRCVGSGAQGAGGFDIFKHDLVGRIMAKRAFAPDT